jgi:predicted PurR-regulated permease PerM
MTLPVERREIVFSRALHVLLGVLALAAVLYWLRAVLTPLFLAFTIAYILDPVVDRFERLRMPRPLGIAIVLTAALLLFGLFLALVLPSIAMDVASVAGELPRHAQGLLETLEERLAAYGVAVPHTVEELVQRFGAELQAAAGTLVSSASGALYWVVGSTASMVGSLVAALIVPVFAIYLLNDFDRMTRGVHDLLPMRFREPVVSYAREIDSVLSHFLRGQVTVMFILALLYGGTYAALGIRLAIPIGIAAGILNIVPYLGSAFALLSGILMSLIGGWNPTQLVGVVVAYAVIQTLEGFVITPRIVGKNVGLSDLWVLFALFVGGELFGFMGVLIAVPMAAVAKIFVLRWVERYRSSELFRAP